MSRQTHFCSFCGKSQYEVKKLLIRKERPTYGVCDECVQLCLEDLAGDVALDPTYRGEMEDKATELAFSLDRSSVIIT